MTWWGWLLIVLAVFVVIAILTRGRALGLIGELLEAVVDIVVSFTR